VSVAIPKVSPVIPSISQYTLQRHHMFYFYTILAIYTTIVWKWYKTWCESQSSTVFPPSCKWSSGD
jgi:hypothetical protein